MGQAGEVSWLGLAQGNAGGESSDVKDGPQVASHGLQWCWSRLPSLPRGLAAEPAQGLLPRHEQCIVSARGQQPFTQLTAAGRGDGLVNGRQQACILARGDHGLGELEGAPGHAVELHLGGGRFAPGGLQMQQWPAQTALRIAQHRSHAGQGLGVSIEFKGMKRAHGQPLHEQLSTHLCIKKPWGVLAGCPACKECLMTRAPIGEQQFHRLEPIE